VALVAWFSVEYRSITKFCQYLNYLIGCPAGQPDMPISDFQNYGIARFIVFGRYFVGFENYRDHGSTFSAICVAAISGVWP
jgi:hypothetical protein